MQGMGGFLLSEEVQNSLQNMFKSSQVKNTLLRNLHEVLFQLCLLSRLTRDNINNLFSKGLIDNFRKQNASHSNS